MNNKIKSSRLKNIAVKIYDVIPDKVCHGKIKSKNAKRVWCHITWASSNNGTSNRKENDIDSEIIEIFLNYINGKFKKVYFANFNKIKEIWVDEMIIVKHKGIKIRMINYSSNSFETTTLISIHGEGLPI